MKKLRSEAQRGLHGSEGAQLLKLQEKMKNLNIKSQKKIEIKINKL